MTLKTGLQRCPLMGFAVILAVKNTHLQDILTIDTVMDDCILFKTGQFSPASVVFLCSWPV